MDEATAFIDNATEKKLQQMNNEDFREASVMIIAHRLGTVLASDRVMVLSDGRVVEFDSPQNFVNNQAYFMSLSRQKDTWTDCLNSR
uniref:ABC transporter n=1 Tax=Peronospora matthiolae TaxID=2874970 RepID=A0AAV1UEN8_9STRA